MKGSNILGRLKKKFLGDEKQKVFGWISVGKFRCGGMRILLQTCLGFIAVCRTFAIDRSGHSRLFFTGKKN